MSLRKSLLLGLLLLTGCYRAPRCIEPHLCEPLHPKEEGVCVQLPADFSISPFPCLTPEELSTDWGKELQIALCFAADFDLYRAITGFKRALYLMPKECHQRRLEVEYDIALSYYLGKKYMETIRAVEGTELVCIDTTFPATHDLLLVLYDCRKKLGQTKEATYLLTLIEKLDHCEGEKLVLLSALEAADLATIDLLGHEDPSRDYMSHIVACYNKEKKSVKKAELLNAVLPGSGYWYVGQRQTAVTAFLVNALFIGAGATFLAHDNYAAGIITFSLESGWYFGGIYGGGLAAKYYNERLYNTFAERIAAREQLYPLMMLNYTF
jgi:hypothetical protein